MSRFLTKEMQNILPYTPGEQPKDNEYVKLNTNESPFKIPNDISEVIYKDIFNLNLYPDPQCRELKKIVCDIYKVKDENVIATNGSDEGLAFIFRAFANSVKSFCMPDITYSFYQSLAYLTGSTPILIPLKDDLSINLNDYYNSKYNIVIPNPNAPTGIALSKNDIENIIKTNKNNIVLIDEAYNDFGSESVIPLIEKYDNLIVIRTFSKSHSGAGIRLGLIFSNKDLIDDIMRIKYSINPYSLNSLALSFGINVLKNEQIFKDYRNIIIQNREDLKKELINLGFTMPDSKANFVFVKSNKIKGKDLYEKLKKRGILIRHFDSPRITDYNRITIGNKEQMNILIKNIKDIIKETK